MMEYKVYHKRKQPPLQSCIPDETKKTKAIPALETNG